MRQGREQLSEHTIEKIEQGRTDRGWRPFRTGTFVAHEIRVRDNGPSGCHDEWPEVAK